LRFRIALVDHGQHIGMLDKLTSVGGRDTFLNLADKPVVITNQALDSLAYECFGILALLGCDSIQLSFEVRREMYLHTSILAAAPGGRAHYDTSTAKHTQGVRNRLSIRLLITEMSRTARFAQFLRDAVAIKSKTVTEVNKYPTVIWFSDLPTGLAEVRSPLLQADWPSDDIRWLVVSRVPEPDRPSPPNLCGPWLTGVMLDDPGSWPELNSHYSTHDEHGEVVAIPPDNEAVRQWDEYVTQNWAKWARKAAISRTIKPFYQKLFAAHQQLQGRDDAYDLYIGTGLIDSRTDSTQRLHRHLFAFPAELVLDEKSGALSVGPSADFVTLKAELDFFPPRIGRVFSRNWMGCLASLGKSDRHCITDSRSAVS